jgi:tartrate dehydratase beta subunit/fumarate hydratase class I family protein
MGAESARAMKSYNCIHATPMGVTPNLFIEKIKIINAYLYEELGSIEAAWHLKLEKLGPFLVDIDCHGRNYFDELDIKIEKNKHKVYEFLNIPKNFSYTKLY